MIPIRYLDENNVPRTPVIEDSTKKLFNLNVKDDGIPLFGNTDDSATSKPVAKKQPKKEKSIKPAPGGGVMVTADDGDELPMYYTNQPYLSSYDETNNILKGSLGTIDALSSTLIQEFEAIRASKTLKGKYKYLTDMASALGSLQSTKVTTVREMNKTIGDCHNLELKRMKETKVDANAVSDDKVIQDTYNAFMSMPYGAHAANVPSPLDISLLGGNNPLPRMNIGSSDFANYQQNITPTQNSWRMEGNPNIKTVVVYDAATGGRYFDVVDSRTGASVPNIEKPDQMFLEDTVLDIHAARAMNSNLGREWDMVIMNGNPNLSKY